MRKAVIVRSFYSQVSFSQSFLAYSQFPFPLIHLLRRASSEKKRAAEAAREKRRGPIAATQFLHTIGMLKRACVFTNRKSAYL